MINFNLMDDIERQLLIRGFYEVKEPSGETKLYSYENKCSHIIINGEDIEIGLYLTVGINQKTSFGRVNRIMMCAEGSFNEEIEIGNETIFVRFDSKDKADNAEMVNIMLKYIDKYLLERVKFDLVERE